MSTVLFVKANNRPAEQAVSVKLHEAFLESYKASHPEDTVIELDLFAEQLPYLDSTMITGMFKAAKGFESTAEEQAAAATANRYLDQFLAADKVVFSFPLWNFTLPAVLHTYIDYLSQAGKTFGYTAEGPVGLVPDKKVALLNARGGVYSEGPMASIEMSVNFLTNVLAFWGIKEVTKVIVEGHNQFPDRTEQIIADGVERATVAARAF
ncbi:FMN-dependent NADH-azoreductase [Paenibacillus puerhi]|uniref:FMN-dependent NADH-azoreductase n=1 Tax=Paenibacillus puerhi TaxID=2692622 RepID=UPI00135B6EFC|nr:FMN-dependent NADH-azoreductase [Paenibacillus puerhi]